MWRDGGKLDVSLYSFCFPFGLLIPERSRNKLKSRSSPVLSDGCLYSFAFSGWLGRFGDIWQAWRDGGNVCLSPHTCNFSLPHQVWKCEEIMPVCPVVK